MLPSARSFYRRYYVLTVLLPAYCMALLFYGTAALSALALRSGNPAGWSGLLLFTLSIGLSRLLGWLGFVASGVPRTVRRPIQPELDRLLRLRASGLPFPEPVVLELGAIPFIAAGGWPCELMISNHLLEITDDAQLRCLLAHEQAHTAQPRSGCAWEDLGWLAAYPLCWLLAGWPLAIPLAAAVHVSLWLRWQNARQFRREAAADLLAAATVGREAYLSALTAYLAQHEQPGGGSLRRARLRGMGLSAAEIEQWLA